MKLIQESNFVVQRDEWLTEFTKRQSMYEQSVFTKNRQLVLGGFKFIRFMDAQMFGEIEFAFTKGPRNGEKFKIQLEPFNLHIGKGCTIEYNPIFE